MRTLEEKIEDFIVLKNDFGETEKRFITYRRNFESVAACDCYEDFGQKIGCEAAGCYSVDNSYSDAREDCVVDFYDSYGVDTEITVIDDYDELLEKSEIFQKFAEAWDLENGSHEHVQAWTYWDGHNFKSIILGGVCGYDSEWHEVTTEESAEILSEFQEIEGLGLYDFYRSDEQSNPFIADCIRK